MQQINRYSLRQLSEGFDFNLSSLWTHSYFVSSTGAVSSEIIEGHTATQTGE